MTGKVLVKRHYRMWKWSQIAVWFTFKRSRSNIVQFRYDSHATTFLEFDIHGSIDSVPKRHCTCTAKIQTVNEASSAVVPEKAYPRFTAHLKSKKRTY